MYKTLEFFGDKLVCITELNILSYVYFVLFCYGLSFRRCILFYYRIKNGFNGKCMYITFVFIFVYTLNNNIGFVQSLAVGKPEEREHLENLGIDASIIL